MSWFIFLETLSAIVAALVAEVMMEMGSAMKEAPTGVFFFYATLEASTDTSFVDLRRCVAQLRPGFAVPTSCHEVLQAGFTLRSPPYSVHGPTQCTVFLTKYAQIHLFIPPIT